MTKGNGLRKFCKEIFENYLHTNRQRTSHIFSFLNYTSGYLKICIIFAYLKWHAQGLLKNVYFILLEYVFLQTFLLYNWIKIYNVLADSEYRA